MGNRSVQRLDFWALTFGLTALVGMNACVTVANERPEPNPQRPEDVNPHVWEPRTKSVAVFKNGLGFFTREGSVKVRDGWCVARQVPPAAFGTLAIFSHDPTETVDIIGSGPGEIVEFDGRDASDDTTTKQNRLHACVNLKLQLDYVFKGQDRTAAGKLVSAGPDFAVLDNGDHTFAVPVSGIKRLQVLELPLRIHIDRSTEHPPEETTLGMAYLRQGITWIPEYTLNILDSATAELTLRGTLVNEAEDLIHTDVHLVVGVPHFVHTEYMAPISVGQVIRTIGASVAPQAVRTQIANRAAITSNSLTAPQLEVLGSIVERPADIASGDLNKALGNLPQLTSVAATDYTVYTKKDLTLRCGEKAIISLFRTKISFSHVYRWTPPGRIEHSLVLHNQADTAWTTGPCLAISAERPLSEDLLRYTPIGGQAELPVTTAVNIAHHRTEREANRELKAHSPARAVYLDLVTLEGTLSLRNFEKSPIDIVIQNEVPGKPTNSSDDGAISVDSANLQLLTRSGLIHWKIRLEPGEEKRLTYQYERYVKSNP